MCLYIPNKVVLGKMSGCYIKERGREWISSVSRPELLPQMKKTRKRNKKNKRSRQQTKIGLELKRACLVGVVIHLKGNNFWSTKWNITFWQDNIILAKKTIWQTNQIDQSISFSLTIGLKIIDFLNWNISWKEDLKLFQW